MSGTRHRIERALDAAERWGQGDPTKGTAILGQMASLDPALGDEPLAEATALATLECLANDLKARGWSVEDAHCLRFGDDAEPLAGRAGMGVGEDAYRQHGG